MIDQDLRDELLSTLKAFHDFCESHNLKYYLIGGGLIGIVRHEGFVPWDNDIDVAMPRSDYNKFLSLKKSLPDGFDLYIPFKDQGYTNTKPRMYSQKTMYQEVFLKRYPIGAWIDIFPLDNTFDNSYLRRIHFKAVYILKIMNACKLGGIDITNGPTARAKYLLYRTLKPIPKTLLAKALELSLTLKKTPSIYLGNLMGRWGNKEIIESNELDSRLLYKFENIDVFSFKNYDKWLSRVYGDYLKLPDLKDRIPDHPLEKIE